MEKIEAKIKQQEMLCVDAVAGPTSFVVFGASGDLAHRKLFHSLYELYRRQLVSERFYLIGCGRSEFSDETFQKSVETSIRQSFGEIDDEKLTAFVECFYYISGDYAKPELYGQICERMSQLDEKHDIDGSRIFYLSVPPFLYETIIDSIGQMRMMCPAASGRIENIRLVVEKPFGSDLDSARQLDQKLHLYFDESQIYRIDHYLGKETVQNLLMFRFANSIFEPIWNRNFIEQVQITISETVGVEHRAGYYEKTGALRDMFQNHMLQMMALVAMEPPVSFAADSVRDEKAKLLRSLRPVTTERVDRDFVRAQYKEGVIDGDTVCGYRQEQGVAPDSTTETFVATRLYVDNWRWRDVPFYLRTGKRLEQKITEILITFKEVPHSMFLSAGLDDIPQNTLRFQIQPDEGIYMSLQAKRPGSKICMSTLEMAVDYQKIFGFQMPEAYQRLLLDCMLGDQTLFARSDSIETAWKLIMPIIRKWEDSDSGIRDYSSGSSADEVLAMLL